MVKNGDEWEDVLARLSREQQEPHEEKTSKGLVLLSAMCALIVVTSITGVCLMGINQVLVNAWPNMTSISQGIGYQSACIISALAWIIVVLKAAAVSNVKGGNYTDES